MTPEVIVPPDPVKLAISWLQPALPGVAVVKNRPNPTEGHVITVRRSGGMRPIAVVDQAWLSVECFAPTDEAVADLAHLVWGLLHAMKGQVIGGVQCYQVLPLGGPADFPDPGPPSKPRYTMSVQASFRAKAI